MTGGLGNVELTVDIALGSFEAFRAAALALGIVNLPSAAAHAATVLLQPGAAGGAQPPQDLEGLQAPKVVAVVGQVVPL